MHQLAKKIINNLTKKKLTISVAESCTGGLLSSAITSVSGSSNAFSLGLVTYSNQSKINILKVPKNIIGKYGAVSEQNCFAMIKGLSKISGTDICVAITGIAGPNGGSVQKPVGLVFVGIKKNNKIVVKKYLVENKGRFHIQKAAVIKSLKLILKYS